LIGDHVEIEDLKLPKYNQFVSDCLLLALLRDNEEQKTILDALTMAFTSLEEWNCINVWKEIQNFRQSESLTVEARDKIILKFNTKIPQLYQETLLACKNFEGPLELCFDDLEIMLHAKFQGFITQFMETESFIHLKRTLLSDFMIGQQGGDQTLDNILSCIMGNCILFAFASPEVQGIFDETNDITSELSMKRIVFYLEAEAFEHFQNRSQNYMRQHASRILRTCMDENFAGTSRYNDIKMRIADTETPILNELFSMLKQDAIQWLIQDVFPILKQSKFLGLVKTLNDEQLSRKLPRTPSRFNIDGPSGSSESSFINKLAQKHGIDLEEENYHQWFNCALDRDGFLYQGSFYIFSNHLVFTCNVMGVLKQSLCLELDKVKRIKKRTTIAIFPTALEITMKDASYMFRSFITRDLCFELIKKQMIDHRNRREGNSEGPAPLTPMKSIYDHSKESSTANRDVENLSDGESILAESRPNGSIDRSISAENSVPLVDSGNSVLNKIIKSEEDDVSFANASLPTYEDDFLKGAELELQQEYLLPFPISQFISTFLIDGCRYSIIHHASTAGHKSPETTIWVEDSNDWFKRDYKYRADIKDVPSFVPGVPKDTAVEVIIRCKMLAPGAFVYHQRMESLDAPYANTFFLHEVWEIRQSQGKCQLKFFIGMEWRQSTWLANTIRTRAVKEALSASETYFRILQRKYVSLKPRSNVKEKSHNVAKDIKEKPILQRKISATPNANINLNDSNLFKLLLAQFIIFFLVILYFAYEMRQMRKETSELLSHLREQYKR